MSKPIGQDLINIIDQIIREGESLVDEVEVYISQGTSISAELKKTEIGLATGSRMIGFGIRTVEKGRIGSSGSSDPMQWRSCLASAISSGRLATAQEWGGLPEPSDAVNTTHLAYDPSVSSDPVQVQKMIGEMLAGAGEYPVNVTSGSADISIGHSTIVNSHGIRYSKKKTLVSASLETISGQSTGYEFDQSVTKDIDPVGVGKKAAFLAHHGVNGEEIKTGSYQLILSPMALAQLLGTVFVPAVNGRNVHAGRSKLASLLGEKVADRRISITDDPFRMSGPGSTWWDGEGVPTRKIEVVKEGVLTEFLYDLKTGYRYGAKSTGSALRSGYGGAPGIGFHNFILDGPRSVTRDEKAIYVHDVVGAHTANPMSGDFSVEISNPTWISDGEFSDPIRKAMYAGNVFDLLNEIEGMGEGERIVGSMVLPEVRLSPQKIIGS